MAITVATISRMRETLLSFHAKTGQFVQDHTGRPAVGSQALSEQAAYSRPQSILSVYSIGNLLVEHGAEHLTAFVKLVTEPVEVIACWTCVRSMLESCALASWLLDPGIDAHTRVGRVFALRYEGMDQQLKFARAAGRPASDITAFEDRIGDVERDAVSLGFTPLVTKGKRSGIAQLMPSATEMIRLMLDEEVMYRMLSAVAHGHFWAISQLSYQASGGDLDIAGVVAKPFEKTGNLQGIALLGTIALKALARPLWNQCRYFGWQQLRLEELFEDAADGLGMTPVSRFWRS